MVSHHRGKTEVDVSHLIRIIIPKQYRIDIREASLVELIANALDAKPSCIWINVATNKGTVEVEDDGDGMDRKKFSGEYHDITPSKTIGTGIGFAGQGAKLALNFCKKIVTETWSQTYRGWSEWYLEGKDAPYTVCDDQLQTLTHRGTKVTLYLNEDTKTFYTCDRIEQILIRHYQPLLDNDLLKAYAGDLPIIREGRGLHPVSVSRPIYKEGLTFLINNKPVGKRSLAATLEKQKEVWITLQRRKKVRAIFGLSRDQVAEDLQGVAVCTFGKVIERTWFRKEPPEKGRIVGWIEVPELIAAVTTDKCSFQQGNKLYESFFRKAQIEFTNWLDEIGLSEKLLTKRDDLSTLEQEINSILRSIPDLDFFVAKTARTVAISGEDGQLRELGEGTQLTRGTKGGAGSGGGIRVHPGSETGKAPTTTEGLEVPATEHQRNVRGGIRLASEQNPSMQKEARFDGETVVINRSHPAYIRAEKQKLLNYHIVKSVVLSVLEYALEKKPELTIKKAFDLESKMFALWGRQ